MSALIQTRDLQRSFKVRAGLFKPNQTLHAVNGINLSVNRGDVLGIVGEPFFYRLALTKKGGGA